MIRYISLLLLIGLCWGQEIVEIKTGSFFGMCSGYCLSELTITESQADYNIYGWDENDPVYLRVEISDSVDSIVWEKATDDYLILEHMYWNEYRDTYKYGTVDSDDPEVFAIKPDNNIDVYPTPNSVKTISAEYWKTPTEMSVDASDSPIPSRFRKIIIARAKIYYAENEDAPEILEGSLTEFEDLLDKLESDQLPRQKNRRFSQAQNLFDFTVVPE